MLEDLLNKLRENDALRDRAEGDDKVLDEVLTEEMEVRRPSYSSIPMGLSEQVKQSLAQNRISQLFSHQAQAIETALGGKDVILESPTASGKTLSFAAPMLNLLHSDPEARALMIYPMKAVAYDQRRQIRQLCESLGIESWSYDGDTEEEHRGWIRQNPPQILMTNPEYLHRSFLGWSDKHWQSFLQQLRFIVLDEVHEYRGYFGSNMAILMRRFLLKLSRYGNVAPQLFLASATCENAKEHAESLTGRQSIELVSARDQFRPLRHFAFINPKSIPEYNFIDIYRLRIALSAISCFELQKSVLVFVPSINFGERVFKETKAKARDRGLDESQIGFFHAGLPVERKQKIQEKIQQGQIKVLFSTNALELGIDIGKLDGVILAGFPDNTMAAWQRIGRAGRGIDSEAFVLFYALNNPWDKFHAANLSEFVSRKLDEIVSDPDNEVAITKHLPYLLYEAEYTDKQEDESILGGTIFEKLRINLANSGGGAGHPPHYPTLVMRGGMGQKHKLMSGREEVGSISESRKFREAYIGAIFLHDGIKYRVETHGQQVVNLGNVGDYLKTEPRFYTTVTHNRTFAGNRKTLGSILITAMHAELTIGENFSGFDLIDEIKGEVIENRHNNVARNFQKRHAFVLTLENCEGATPLAISTLEQLLRIGAMFIIPADRHDTNTHSSKSDQKSVYLYENYEGGIGVAKKMLSKWVDVIEAGKAIAQKCPCEKGCPNCIMPPRRSDELNKKDGINLAEEIIALWQNDSSNGEHFDSEMSVWRPNGG